MWFGMMCTRSPTSKARFGVTEVDEAVLFVHLVEARAGRLHEPSEGDFGGVGEAVRGESLGAAIDNHLAGARCGDNGGENRGGAIFEPAGAAADGVEVVEDVGSGADLGEAGDFVGVEKRGRGTAADDARLDAGGAKIAEDFRHQRAELGKRVLAGLVERLDMPGIERDTRKAQVGEFFYDLRELNEGLARGDADAAEADIHFGEHPDFHLRGARGIGELPGRETAVERNEDGSFTRHLQ